MSALADGIVQLIFRDVRFDPDEKTDSCETTLDLPFRRTDDPSGFCWDSAALKHARRCSGYRAQYTKLRSAWDTPTGRMRLNGTDCLCPDAPDPTVVPQKSRPQAIGRDAKG